MWKLWKLYVIRIICHLTSTAQRWLTAIGSNVITHHRIRIKKQNKYWQINWNVNSRGFLSDDSQPYVSDLPIIRSQWHGECYEQVQADPACAHRLDLPPPGKNKTNFDLVHSHLIKRKWRKCTNIHYRTYYSYETFWHDTIQNFCKENETDMHNTHFFGTFIHAKIRKNSINTYI